MHLKDMKKKENNNKSLYLKKITKTWQILLKQVSDKICILSPGLQL